MQLPNLSGVKTSSIKNLSGSGKIRMIGGTGNKIRTVSGC